MNIKYLKEGETYTYDVYGDGREIINVIFLKSFKKLSNNSIINLFERKEECGYKFALTKWVIENRLTLKENIYDYNDEYI